MNSALLYPRALQSLVEYYTGLTIYRIRSFYCSFKIHRILNGSLLSGYRSLSSEVDGLLYFFRLIGRDGRRTRIGLGYHHN